MTLSTIEIAWGAMEDLQARRDVAQKALAEFVLRAIVEGEPIDAIMDAAGFPVQPEPDETSTDSMLSLGSLWRTEPRSRRDAFASWVATEVSRLVREAA